MYTEINHAQKGLNMGAQYENLLSGMADAGCSEQDIRLAERLMMRDNNEGLIKCLRRCRAALLERMHESQRRVDRMDYIIIQAEKLIRDEKGL